MGTRVIGDVLTLTVDPGRLHAAIGPRLAAQEQPPVDASFEITEQNTVRVVPSRDGRLIDMRAVAAAILSGQRRIQAPLETVAPAHDTKWAQSLGIVGQVSAYTTDYPSGEARVTNIHRGADLLNDTVVEPGQVFSLNDTIGPRTEERGFVTAPVFAEGTFFDDYGGGVSQLATTTYNAAFWGGYADVTHQPHTIYISRYPSGREATVNYGAIDLQFRNDTGHGVLIRTYYSDTSVTVAFYGDNDRRTVREENRTETNPVPVTDELVECPASKTIDPNAICASLSAGETEQIATGDPGFDVAFDRVIDQPGKTPRREHYTWHYTMLPNRILVGSNPAAATTTTTTRPRANRPVPGSTTPEPGPPKNPPTSANLASVAPSGADRASTGPRCVPIPQVRVPDRGTAWRDRDRAKQARRDRTAGPARHPAGNTVRGRGDRRLGIGAYALGGGQGRPRDQRGRARQRAQEPPCDPVGVNGRATAQRTGRRRGRDTERPRFVARRRRRRRLHLR